MSAIYAFRSHAGEIKWGKLLITALLFGAFWMLLQDPAFAAGDAFGTFKSRITDRTADAAGVIRSILFAAAVVSLLVGVAPMLWGQVKVKWMVTALCACVIFGVIGSLVSAFTGDDSGTRTMGDIGAE